MIYKPSVGLKLVSLDDVEEELEKQEGELRYRQAVYSGEEKGDRNNIEICKLNLDWTKEIIKGLRVMLEFKPEDK